MPLVTTRAFNSRHQRAYRRHPSPPTPTFDASSQGFIIPANASGELSFAFDGEKPYKLSLFGGATIALIVVLLGCAAVGRRREAINPVWQDTRNAQWAVVALIPMLGGAWFVPAVASWLVLRFTLIPKWCRWQGSHWLSADCGFAAALAAAAAHARRFPALALLGGRHFRGCAICWRIQGLQSAKWVSVHSRRF
ncbi:hypothetical protein [Streptomyces sp. NA13]|uniref:hypothetical protein n=1 Tax=Streptomyces sp. NA13 TaxID=2996051 RepID=UPI00226DD216|nr:hypothetical protein [Streptomyces sp. NA13]WAD00564.1 hypothetical protein OSU72_30845 [Streptomyces sp. NA13]